MRPPLTGPQVAPAAAPLFPPFPVVGSVEQLDPALSALIDPAARVEKILDGFGWVEGPVWIGGKDGYVERDGHMVDENDIARRAAFGSDSTAA